MQFEKWFQVDLLNTIGHVQDIGTLMFTGDNNSHKIGVRLYKGNEPQNVVGAVVGYVIRADGGTVVVNGSSSENEAWIILPEAAFAYQGRVSIAIQIVNGQEKTVVLAVSANVKIASTETTVDPGTIMPSVAELIDDIENAVASVPADYTALLGSVARTFSQSTSYTAGKYVWYNGELYRFNVGHPAGAWIGTDAARYTATDELPLIQAKIVEQEETFNEAIEHETPMASLFSNILLKDREITLSGRTVTIKKNWVSVKYVSNNINSRVYNLISYETKQVGIANYVPDESTLIPIERIPAIGQLVMRRSTDNNPSAYSSINLIFCTVDNGTVTVVERKGVSTTSANPFTHRYYNINEIAATHVTIALANYKSVSGMDVDIVFDIIPFSEDSTQLTQDVETLKGKAALNETNIAFLETHKAPQPLDANNQPTNGVAGQLLRTRGDGTTEWSDVGLPTDAQIADAVSSWLDEHPEATSTVDFDIVKKIYPSYTAMVSDQSLSSGNIVQTLGHYVEGDGGGTCYRIVGIEPSAGYYVSVANGYAEFLPGNFLTAEMFGAYGDNTHDDSGAFNAACTWAKYYGIPLHVCKKTYHIAGTISVKEQCKIIGYDNDTCILDYTGDSVCLDVFGNCSVDGIQIKSSSAGVNTIAINVDSTEISSGGGTRKNINIKNCKILQFRKAAISMNNEWQINIDNCRIEGYGRNKAGGTCTGILFDYDGAILSGWTGSGNLITNTYIKMCDYGIYNRGGWDVTVVNCIIEYVKYGIYKYEGGTPTTVIGCWFEEISSDGYGLYGKIFNVIGCRGDATFDQSENTTYGILAIGSYVRCTNFVVYDANKAPYRLSVDTNGNVIATALS